MKDIRKLKLWIHLEQEGFKTKEFRNGGVCFGRGAILFLDPKADFPIMEIKPLLNGHWQLTADYGHKSSSWEGHPFQIAKEFENEIINFKARVNLSP